MGCGIMRCEKRKGSALGGLEAENNRVDRIDLPASDIDWDKTKDNIFLVKNDNWTQAIKDELKDYGITKWRKDAVMAIDTLYTASPDFFESGIHDLGGDFDTIDYFKDCLAFHEKTFGHVINAVVHFDEKTPHLHVISVPIVARGEHYALSAKEMMGNREDYHSRQNDFFNDVTEAWGLDRGEVRDTTERREHLDMLDFKTETKEQELDRLDKAIVDCKDTLERLETMIDERLEDMSKLDSVEARIDKDVIDEIHDLIERLDDRERFIDFDDVDMDPDPV